MKALIWNYTTAVAKSVEVMALEGPLSSRAAHAWAGVREAQQPLWVAVVTCFGPSETARQLLAAIRAYADAFARERMAYRFGVGETAATNVARIAAQRELFAQLAK